MTLFNQIVELAKSVGIPFTLLFYILYRLDHYVIRFLSQFDELKNSIHALTDEVKKLKHYSQVKDPFHEG